MEKRRKKNYRWRIRRRIRNFVKGVVVVASFMALLIFLGVLIKDGGAEAKINDTVAAGKTDAQGEPQNGGQGIDEESEILDGQIEQSAEEFLQTADLSEYRSSLLELIQKNPETASFVMHYPEKKNYVNREPLAEYADCQDVPLLIQWDERWGYYIYGDDVFGLTGCGPTCLSMVAIYLLGDVDMTPVWMADYCITNGYCSVGNGTSWSLMSEGAINLGMYSQEIPLNEQTIANHLNAGHPIICIMGPGDFTDNGHFIVITAWEDGMVAINDPNSRTNSAKLWRFEDIKGQIRNLWAFSVY